MKRAALILPLALALALAPGGVRSSARADDLLPQAPAANRYEKMSNRSPFAPPTPVTGAVVPVAAPPGPKWSDDLTVTLLTQQGGVYFATIQDKSKNEHFLLQSNKEDLDRHLALSSVEWGDLVGQTTVMLRHNNEFASVRFDANAAAAPAPQPGRASIAGTYPPSAGLPAPGRLQPPPGAPPLPPNVQQRRALIRATPTVTAPPVRPPPSLVRRPLSTRDDDNDQ